MGGQGGNLYYKIPYVLFSGGMLDISAITKIVDKLFKKNPDFEHCDIEIGSTDNPLSTNTESITAIVVTSDKTFYDKYSKRAN